MTAQLTFLFTELENSTGLWQQAPMAMQDALGRHDAITRTAVEENNARVVKTTGDGLHSENIVPAVAEAVGYQVQPTAWLKQWALLGRV